MSYTAVTTCYSDEISLYTIVLPEVPSAVEQQAATELRSYIEKMTGGRTEISYKPPQSGTVFYVGETQFARKICGNKEFQQDEILLQSVPDGIVLTGGAPRGTLYAVYEYLELCGVRWWTSTESFVPVLEELPLQKISINHVPSFRTRECYYQDITENPLHASHMRNNGHFENLPEELGGHEEIIGFCHTFRLLVPPEKYFADHPEYFEMRNGERYNDAEEGFIKTGQLCLSNGELRHTLTENALTMLRNHPSPRIISISQNDSWAEEYGCQCNNCAAVNEEEGSPAGLLLLAVNEAAEAIAEEYPDVKVDTLAYRYTRHTPANIRPADNVIVRLCSIECDFSHPLASAENSEFNKLLGEWSKISGELAVWNYVANFSNFLLPHPNISNLAEDLRYLQKMGVVNIFEQGDCWTGGKAGDFPALRAWVISKLMWDTSRDQDKLINEFLAGYYGDAAPYLRRYIDLLETAAAESSVYLSCFESGTEKWLTADVAGEALELLAAAGEAVRDSAVYTERTRRAALPMTLAILLRYDEFAPFMSLPDKNRMTADYLAESTAINTTAFKEAGGFYILQDMLEKEAAAKEK